MKIYYKYLTIVKKCAILKIAKTNICALVSYCMRIGRNYVRNFTGLHKETTKRIY